MANVSSYDDSVKCYTRHELTSEDRRYAAIYLNETDETRESAVAEIKRWLEESDDLHARMDDLFILRFLRGCKFNIEKSKIKIRGYVKQRLDLPEWFMDVDPFRPELQELIDSGLFLPLRKPDNQGRIIFIVRYTRHDPRIHKISDLVKVNMILYDIAMKYYPAASIYGYMLFADISNPTLHHVTQFGPYVIKNLIHTFMNCNPDRVQSFNLFNMPVMFNNVIQILKSFMTEKMKSRFHVYSHQMLRDCFKDIPANILPIEYGGIDGTIQELTEYWKKLIEENREWFKENEKKKFILKR